MVNEVKTPHASNTPHVPMQRLALRLFLAALFFQLTWASGHLYSFDDIMHLETARGLVERQELDVPDTPDNREYARVGRDGRLYSKFGVGMASALAPFVAVGHLFGPDAMLASACFGGAVIAALITPLAAYVALSAGASFTAAITFAFILSFATPWAVYGRGLFNDALTGLLLLAAFHAWQRARPATCGALLAALAATRAEYALAVPAFFIMTPHRRTRLILPLVVGGGLLIAFNTARFGSPMNQGQLGNDPYDTFSTPLWTGLTGLFVSPGKGALWYAAPLWLAIAGMRRFAVTQRRSMLVIALVAAPLLILHAKWGSWMGGWSYGPRRLVALLPLLMLSALPAIESLLARRSGRILLAGITALGFAAQFGGLTVNFMHYIRDAQAAGISVLWSVRGSAMIGSLSYLARTGAWDLWYVHFFGTGVMALASGVLLAVVTIFATAHACRLMTQKSS